MTSLHHPKAHPSVDDNPQNFILPGEAAQAFDPSTRETEADESL